jgi:hypothetical protein
VRYWFVGWKSWRVVCALRRHPQEIGFGFPNELGAGPMFALWKSVPETRLHLAGTSCRCGRRETGDTGSRRR